MSCALFWWAMRWASWEMLVKCSDGTQTFAHRGGPREGVLSSGTSLCLRHITGQTSTGPLCLAFFKYILALSSLLFPPRPPPPLLPLPHPPAMPSPLRASLGCF